MSTSFSQLGNTAAKVYFSKNSTARAEAGSKSESPKPKAQSPKTQRLQ